MAKGSMFFSGRGATSTGQKAEVVSVQVGKRHPYLVPPPEGGQALSLATGFPTFQMFLTPPLDGEISSLSGTLAGCGLFADRSLNAVIPVFVFSGSGAGEWAIHAPVDDSPELVSSWIGSETNIVNFVLMDRSGTVQVLRHIGLPDEFLKAFKTAVAQIRHPAGIDGYAHVLDTIGEIGLWQQSLKWLWDKKAGVMRYKGR